MALALTLPKAHHLHINAQPALIALDEAIASLQSARAEFSGTNDNRAEIEKLANEVVDRASDLSLVLDQDLEALNLSLEWQRLRGVISGLGNEIAQAAGQINSDDPAVSFPLKKFRQSVRALTEKTRAFGESHDNRSAIAPAMAEVRERLRDVHAMETPIDAWGPNRLEASCERLLSTIAQPIVAREAETVHDPRPVNAMRSRLSDELDELSALVARAGASEKRGAVEEVRAAVGKVKALRSEISGNLYEPITDAGGLVARLQDIQADVRRLEQLRCEATQQLGFMQPHTPPIHAQIAKIRAMVAPDEHAAQSRPASLLSRIGQAFGWENDETPEVA